MTTTHKVYLDDEGREIPDDTPIVIMVNSRPVTDYDRIRELIAMQMSVAAANSGMETLEEANDFDVEDDLFPVSEREYSEETEAADREALAVEQERRRRAKEARENPSRQRRRKADVEDESSSEGGVQPRSASPRSSGESDESDS